jgi:hypothetical protein
MVVGIYLHSVVDVNPDPFTKINFFPKHTCGWL